MAGESGDGLRVPLTLPQVEAMLKAIDFVLNVHAALPRASWSDEDTLFDSTLQAGRMALIDAVAERSQAVDGGGAGNG